MPLYSSVDAIENLCSATTGRDFEPALVAVWSRREDAVGCAHNGEQHEQGRSRQSPPQQGWRNQRQTRKHPHPHVAIGLRTEFRSRLSRNRELSEVLLKLNKILLSQVRRDHQTGHLEHKIANASK
jgi:hypothetical protein